MFRIGGRIFTCRIGISFAASVAIIAATGWAGSMDYPCWRGATGSGAAVPCGEPLADSLADAKLVWATRGILPNAYPEACGDFWQSRQGGQAGPVVADGRVYIWVYEPNGEAYDEAAYRRATETLTRDKHRKAKVTKALKPGQDLSALMRRRLSATADDIVLCLDAATGTVLWRQVYAGRGANHACSVQVGNVGAPKTGPHGKPCTAYGKVFAIGSAGALYCLDARTGEPLWDTGASGTYKRMLDYCRRTNSKVPTERLDQATCPTFAAGCVIVGDGDLVAYDAETGAERWRIPGISVGSYSPLRCILDLPEDAARPAMQAGGEEFIMSARGALVDPREGKVLWRVGGIDSYMCVGEGYLVGRRGGEGLSGYKISKTGAERLWTLDGKKYNTGAHRIPAINNGRLWAISGGANGANSFYSVDLATGKATKPLGSYPDGNRASGSVVMTDNRVFLERSDLIHAEKDGPVWPKLKDLPEAKRPRGSQVIPGHPGLHVANSCTPSIADGRLYLRVDDGLACLDLRKTPKPMKRDPARVAPDPVAEKLGLTGFGSANAAEREAAIKKAEAGQAGKLGRLAVEGRWQSVEAACRALRALGGKGAPASGSLRAGCLAAAPESPAKAELLARTLAVVDPAAGKMLAVKLGPKAAQSAAACAALGGLGEHGRSAEKHLQEALEKDAPIRRHAIEALVRIGGREEGTAMSLVDPDRPVDLDALRALVAMGPASLPALPRVMRILKEADADGKYWALRAIEQMGPAAVKATNAVDKNGVKYGGGGWTRPWMIRYQGKLALAAIAPDLVAKRKKEREAAAAAEADAKAVLGPLTGKGRKPGAKAPSLDDDDLGL